MSYAITHFWPGGTKEQYELEVKALHPADGSLPPGQLFHAAGDTEGGVFIFAVYETKEGWEKFRDEVVLPRSSQVVDGFPAPPVERDIELFHIYPDHILGD